MPGARVPTVGHFVLVLEGVRAGFLRGVSGGGITADVIVEQSGDVFAKKRLGEVRYEPFELTVDFPFAKPVQDWITQTWQGHEPVRSGSVVALDQTFKPISERQFTQASLAAVTVPTLDAAATQPGFFTLQIAPTSTRLRKSSGPAATAPIARPAKQWLVSNFRLEIDGLDTTRVRKIDSFAVRSAGKARLDFPHLRITLADVGAQSWLAWHEDFVVKGKNDDSNEKSGTISLLAPTLDVLGTIRLHNLGIFGLAPAARPPGSTQVASLVADLYCERMELVI